jgi:hypothetical protein
MARKATSRDPEAWQEATAKARLVRERVAGEVGEAVRELIIEGDIMGAPSTVVLRLRQVQEARVRGDAQVLRAAWMELAAAAGGCVAAIDLGSSDG